MAHKSNTSTLRSTIEEGDSYSVFREGLGVFHRCFPRRRGYAVFILLNGREVNLSTAVDLNLIPITNNETRLGGDAEVTKTRLETGAA